MSALRPGRSVEHAATMAARASNFWSCWKSTAFARLKRRDASLIASALEEGRGGAPSTPAGVKVNRMGTACPTGSFTCSPPASVMMVLTLARVVKGGSRS